MTDMRDASTVLTTKDVILEIRGDLKQVASDVAGIKIEQARVAAHLQAEQNIGTDRRQRMSEVQIGINTRMAAHDVEIGELKEFKTEAVGAIKLAKWAMGASLLASVLVIVEIIAGVTVH